MTTESGPRKLTNEEIEAVSGGAPPLPPNLNAEGVKDQSNPLEKAEGLTDISEGTIHHKHI